MHSIPPALKPLAVPLGELVLAWSRIEGEIHRLLVIATDAHEQFAELAYLQMDVRDKMQAVKTCCFLKQPDPLWFGSLETHLNEIDNQLRPLRNRMIHDFWQITDGGHAYRRTSSPPRIVRESPQKRRVYIAEHIPMEPADIAALVARVLNEAHVLSALSAILLTHHSFSPEGQPSEQA